MKRIILFLGICGCSIVELGARDLGQWEGGDPAIRQWYQSLMQPDVPTSSCCGEADAYWADEIHVRNGRTSCASPMTPGWPLAGRTSKPEIEIALQAQMGPVQSTGHGIVFMSRTGYVFCYVQPGRV